MRANLRRAAIPALMLVLLLLAAATRLHRLDGQSLWYDEGVTAAHAVRDLPELIPLLQVNVHTPAYFVMLLGWTDLAGMSEFALRAPSVFFSILSVAWTFALGARLLHPVAGLAAAALVALNSFSMLYAQEARMYAMLTAIAGASMWLFVGALLGRRQARTLLALALVNALGMYTQVVFALVMLAQTLVALLWAGEGLLRGRAVWRRLGGFLLANCLTVILFLPWLPHSLQQVFSRPNRADVIPADEVLLLIGGHFAFGSNYALDMGAAGLAVLILLLAGLLSLAWRRGVWRWSLPVVWLLVSVLPYVSLALTTRYLRFLLPAQLAFALLLGRGAWTLWRGLPLRFGLAAGKVAALALLCAVWLAMAGGLPTFYTHSDFQRDDMRGLVARMQTDLRADDGIIFSAPGLVDLLSYYYAGAAPTYSLPSARHDDERTRAEVMDIIAAHPRLHVILYGAHEQDPNHIVENTLNGGAVEVRDQWVGDIRYLQYVRRAQFDEATAANLAFGDEITLESYALEAAALRPGDVLQAQFVWTARQPIRARYKVFLQLLDESGALAAQRDSQPNGGAAPTTGWTPGQRVIDHHALPIPPDLRPGQYRLIAGLYDAYDPLARLPVAGGNYVDLGEISVLE